MCAQFQQKEDKNKNSKEFRRELQSNKLGGLSLKFYKCNLKKKLIAKLKKKDPKPHDAHPLYLSTSIILDNIILGSSYAHAFLFSLKLVKRVKEGMPTNLQLTL